MASYAERLTNSPESPYASPRSRSFGYIQVICLALRLGPSNTSEKLPPATEVSWSATSIAASDSGSGSVSACRNQRTLPFAARVAVCICLPRPASHSTMTAPASRARETVESVLPPSATMISFAPCNRFRTASISAIRFASLSVGMIMLVITTALRSVADVEISTEVETHEWADIVSCRTLQTVVDPGTPILHALKIVLYPCGRAVAIVGANSPTLRHVCSAWLFRSSRYRSHGFVRNIRRREGSAVAPLFAAPFCLVSAYLYLIIADRNIPIWVYCLLVAMALPGAWSTIRKVRHRLYFGGRRREI